MSDLSFLGLPQELRDKNYRYALVSDHQIAPMPETLQEEQHKFSSHRKQRMAKSNSDMLKSNILDTELLAVNKQISAEAWDIFVSENTF